MSRAHWVESLESFSWHSTLNFLSNIQMFINQNQYVETTYIKFSERLLLQGRHFIFEHPIEGIFEYLAYLLSHFILSYFN